MSYNQCYFCQADLIIKERKNFLSTGNCQTCKYVHHFKHDRLINIQKRFKGSNAVWHFTYNVVDGKSHFVKVEKKIELTEQQKYPTIGVYNGVLQFNPDIVASIPKRTELTYDYLFTPDRFLKLKLFL